MSGAAAGAGPHTSSHRLSAGRAANMSQNRIGDPDPGSVPGAVCGRICAEESVDQPALFLARRLQRRFDAARTYPQSRNCIIDPASSAWGRAGNYSPARSFVPEVFRVPPHFRGPHKRTGRGADRNWRRSAPVHRSGKQSSAAFFPSPGKREAHRTGFRHQPPEILHVLRAILAVADQPRRTMSTVTSIEIVDPVHEGIL